MLTTGCMSWRMAESVDWNRMPIRTRSCRERARPARSSKRKNTMKESGRCYAARRAGMDSLLERIHPRCRSLHIGPCQHRGWLAVEKSLQPLACLRDGRIDALDEVLVMRQVELVGNPGAQGAGEYKHARLCEPLTVGSGQVEVGQLDMLRS